MPMDPARHDHYKNASNGDVEAMFTFYCGPRLNYGQHGVLDAKTLTQIVADDRRSGRFDVGSAWNISARRPTASRFVARPAHC